MSKSERLKDLDDWVAAGLITPEQADAIRSHESEGQKEPSGWVEPVAYLGAALIGVALFLFGVEVWDQLSAWGRVALSALITVVVFSAGLVLRRSGSEAAGRAASFSWFLVVAGVAATAGLLFSDIIEFNPDWRSLVVSSIVLAAAVGLYIWVRRGLQLVAVAVATASFVTSLTARRPVDEVWIVGLLFLTVGLVWLLLTWAGFLEPPLAGWILGSVFAIGVGIGSFDDNALWSVLGIVVGLGLVWLSTRLDRRSLLALGVVALLIWIPATVTILFENSIPIPVAILITGVVTLTVVIAAVRFDRTATAQETLPGGSDGQR
ncbi:MAG TPA: DUF2157 domain-containing protein [Acidimicrobiia bacterium]|nr:DUF2157 domain-containing protein [Acidimicrobiia bacterium]